MAHPARDARDRAQQLWPSATVVARFRNSIKHQHPTDPNRFMLDLGIGPMHYGPTEDQEINTAWQPGTAPWDFEMVQAGYNAFALADFSSGQIVKYVHPGTGESIAFQPQQLQYTNDLDQIQAIANPQAVTAVVQNEDVLFWQGAFGPGMDIRWQTQTTRLDKRFVVDQASRWPAPTAQIIAGGNPVARLQFVFQVSNNLDIFVNGLLWNRAVNKPVDTQGYIEFRHSTTGEVLWTFNLPRSNGAPVEDQDPDELLGIFRVRRTGPNLFVEHRIPIAWLQAADYPIEIDTTIDEQVGANSDDAFQATTDGMFLSSQNQLVDATTEHVGLRWTTIALDGTETIDLATVEVTITDATTDEPQHQIRGELSPNPGTFTTGANDIDGRNRTTATVQWNSTDLFASGTDVAYEWGATAGDPTNGADLSAIVQELIDQGSWASGNAMVMIYEQHTGSSSRDLAIRTYDYNTALAAKLHIEYSSGGVVVTPAAAEAVAASVDPTVVLGSLVLAPTAASAVALALDPAVVNNVVYEPVAASGVILTLDPTVVLGSLLVAPGPATARAETIDPVVVLGSLVLAPSPAVAITTTVDPSVVLGSLTIAPAPASAVILTIDPSVVEGGGLTVSPEPAFAVAEAVGPTVVLGSVTITPVAAYAVPTVVDPAVVQGSLTIAPTAASAIALMLDPQVIAVVLYEPAPASAVALTVDPATVLGSMTITPPPAYAVVTVVDPTVVLGSLLILPAPATVVILTIDPFVGAAIAFTSAVTLAGAFVVASELRGSHTPFDTITGEAPETSITLEGGA